MKPIGVLLMALALAATGCVELPTWADAKARHTDAPPPAPVEAPPVSPDQVNDANAPRVLNALRDELDRAGDDKAPAAEKMP